MRIGIIGFGTIGKFVFEHVQKNNVPGGTIAVILVRTIKEEVAQAAKEANALLTTNWEDLLHNDVDVVVETASHEALEAVGLPVLRSGIDLITLSIGALVDTTLLKNLQQAAKEGNSLFQVPSGGIGGLDALQTALIAGVEKVTMTTRKAPIAWTEIPYVQKLGVDLENMSEKTVLYEGPAAECVKEFPKNINIAAALSLAGIGFEKTIIRIIADPEVEFNTHEIACEGAAGKFTMVLENVPVPENPRTTYMACLSAVAALNRIHTHYRVGT